MIMVILRVSLLILVVLFLLANVVIPAFMQNVPFFWMFRIRKAEKKYEQKIEELDNSAMDDAVRESIEHRENSKNQ